MMGKLMVKLCWISSLFFINCTGQDISSNIKTKVKYLSSKESIWVPEYEVEEVFYEGESVLIFENEFRDSIKFINIADYNDSYFIETNTRLSMCINTFKFNSDSLNFLDILFNKKEVLRISLKKPYKFIYISNYEGNYYTEYSNFKRLYR